MSIGLISIVIVIILVGLWFSSFKKTHTKLVKDTPLTDNYLRLLEQHVSFYQQLDLDKKAVFARKINSFLSRTHIEGVGTTIEDLDRVLIAASAIIPVFGFENWEYRNLTNVILYPDTFNNEFQFEGEGRNTLGMVGNGFMNGQMVLSKSALHKGFSSQSGTSNTAIHEFVHLLDNADGSTDGIPEHLMQHDYSDPWLKAMHKEIHRIQEGHSDINPYAITNEAEFLAVVSEYFFEKPGQFKQKHPDLYEILDQMFNPDQLT